MEYLTNETLDNTIKIYKSTIEATNGNREYSPILDRATVAFLEELKEYRAIGTVEDIEKGIKQSEEEFEMMMEYIKAEQQGFLVKIPCHCKDCKHWSDEVAGATEHVKLCTIGGYMVGENGYCVYAERKE